VGVRLDVVMRVVFGSLVVALGVTIPGVLSAQGGLVRMGEEVVVRFPPRSAAIYGAAQISPPTSTLKVLSLTDSISPVLASSPVIASGAPPPRTRGAVTPATPAITARCREITTVIPDAICEPNWVYFAAINPNDPELAGEYAVPNIGMTSAWDRTTGSTAVKVAVIDTGVDYTHPDLIENIARNTAEIPANGIDDDRNGYIDDFLGYNAVEGDGDPLDLNEHGTHVAGTIGAVGNNGIGVAGMNWRVGLVPIRVLDESGAGTIADIVRGIEYAIARRVRIMNLSLGGADYSTVFEQAINAAKDANILTVVASGNEGSINDFFESFPANFKSSSIVSVAAVDSDNALAYFSNIGPETVDLAAPGVSILSTIPGGGYDRFDGTSMAAPHVAGVAALLLAINPRFNYLDLRRILLNSVHRTAELDGLIVTGGIVNGAAAVETALRTAPTRFTLGFGVKLSRSGSSLVADVRDRDGGRAGIRVSFQCGAGKKVIAATRRSGKAAVKLSKLTALKRPTTCRARTLNARIGARSKSLKVR
jgi:subtilisin family serine protease